MSRLPILLVAVLLTWSQAARGQEPTPLVPFPVEDLGGDWPMFRANPRRTGEGGLLPPDEIRLGENPLDRPVTGPVNAHGYGVAKKWRFDPSVVGHPVRPIRSSPAVALGRVFVGCDNGWFYCLRRSSGACLWSRYIGAPVRSSPAVSKKSGLVYLAAVAENGKAYLYCWDRLGAARWKYCFEQEASPVVSSPLVVDLPDATIRLDYRRLRGDPDAFLRRRSDLTQEVVFASCGSRLYAIRAGSTSPSLLWAGPHHYETVPETEGFKVPLAHDGSAGRLEPSPSMLDFFGIFATGSGSDGRKPEWTTPLDSEHELDASGNGYSSWRAGSWFDYQWRNDSFPATTTVTSLPGGGLAFAGGETISLAGLQSLYGQRREPWFDFWASPAIVWRQQEEQPARLYAIFAASSRDLSLAGSKLLVLDWAVADSGPARDAGGQMVASAAIPLGSARVFASPAVCGDRAYVANDAGYVSAIRFGPVESGRVDWKYRVRGAVRSSPALSSGVLFVGTDGGYVYALADATTTTLQSDVIVFSISPTQPLVILP